MIFKNKLPAKSGWYFISNGYYIGVAYLCRSRGYVYEAGMESYPLETCDLIWGEAVAMPNEVNRDVD